MTLFTAFKIQENKDFTNRHLSFSHSNQRERRSFSTMYKKINLANVCRCFLASISPLWPKSPGLQIERPVLSAHNMLDGNLQKRLSMGFKANPDVVHELGVSLVLLRELLELSQQYENIWRGSKLLLLAKNWHCNN